MYHLPYDSYSQTIQSLKIHGEGNNSGDILNHRDVESNQRIIEFKNLDYTPRARVETAKGRRVETSNGRIVET